MRVAWAFLVAACGSLANAEDLARPMQGPADVAQIVADTDSLIVAGQFDRITGAARGGGGAVDWVRTRADGTTLTAGIAHYALGGSEWTLARGGGALRFDDRVIVQGEASAGGGRADGASFSYLVLVARLHYRLASAAYLGLEERYIDIAATHGHLPKVSALIVASPALSADIGYARSAGGNLDTEFATARIDWQTRTARLFGGFVRGRIAPTVVNVDVGAGAPSKALREWFLGIAVPVSRIELTVSTDTIKLTDVRRQIVTVGVRIPIGGA